LTLVHEVASHRRLRETRSQFTRRAESLNSEAHSVRRSIEILRLESVLISWSRHITHARFTSIDVDCMVLGFHVQSDFLALVHTSESRNLGGVEGGDIASDGINALDLEVDIVNSEIVVEPIDLFIDEILRYPGTAL
jgi:hypothetical protein